MRPRVKEPGYHLMTVNRSGDGQPSIMVMAVLQDCEDRRAMRASVVSVAFYRFVCLR